MAKAKKHKLPKLAPVPKKEKSGRKKRTPEVVSDRNPAGVSLKARARRVGLPTDRHGQQIAKAPWYETEQGCAIAVVHNHRAHAIAPLWQIWAQLSGTDHTYTTRILGLTRHAQGAAIATIPDHVEARPDDRPDDRTPDEKVHDARNAQAAWEGRIHRLDPWHGVAVSAQLTGCGPAVFVDCQATGPGRIFVQAIEALAEVARKER